ncbi:hypothetical protein OQA88_6305 [Cercophora sp. LCS_1]
MFYSHEILTDQRHGVATVWLASTIGLRSNARRITRKAIQEVNVRKACETIIQPGAPIALRLQGSLLFGVSRVYERQCEYVLADAEKIRAHLNAFHTASKRENLMLLDDPSFDLDLRLPTFYVLDDDGNLVDPIESQVSRKTSSQLSPFTGSGANSSVAGGSFLGGFDFPAPPSSRPRSSIDLPENMMLDMEAQLAMPEDKEDLVPALDDWGLEIDDDGNIVAVVDEPELPQLPKPRDNSSQALPDEPLQMLDNDQGLVLPSGNPTQGDSQVPRAQNGDEEAEERTDDQQPLEAHDSEIVVGPAPQRRNRRRPKLAPDQETKVSRQELKDWSTNYLDNIERARNKGRRANTVVEARKNAYTVIFGYGLGETGFPYGVPDIFTPLATTFAGDELAARIFGMSITDHDDDDPRGRRRTAVEALESEEEVGRRVRPRLSLEPQSNGQGQDVVMSDGAQILMSDTEMGRDAAGALPDLPSDVPWNRPSSHMPSSSIKGSRHPGSSRQVSASPSQGRGNRLPSDIERYSDQPTLGSDGVDPAYAAATLSDAALPFDDNLPLPAQDARTSQAVLEALDREGRNFLGYVQNMAHKLGEMRADGKHWISFDDLFNAEDQNRAVITRAFYHVLTLVTKDAIKVEQDGQDTVPFGEIRVGVDVPFSDVSEEAA